MRPGIQISLLVLGFNDASALVGHFVSSPREREKIDRRESRGDEREGKGKKREMKENEGTEEIITSPPPPPPHTHTHPYLLQGQQPLPNCKPISVGRPGYQSYRTPLPHPATPTFRSDNANAKVNLNFCRAHMFEGTFSDVPLSFKQTFLIFFLLTHKNISCGIH